MSGTNGSTPRRLDLDARRAARAETRGESLGGVTIGGDFYPYAPELPLDVLDAFSALSPLPDDASPAEKMAQGAAQASVVQRMLRAIVGVAVYEELLEKHALSIEDAQEIMEDALDAYGIPLGSSPDAESSSPGTSTPSKPPSSRSTAATSRPRSGAKAATR